MGDTRKTGSNSLHLALAVIIYLIFFVQDVTTGAAGVSYNYEGNDWTGTCATGKRQTPIDFPTDLVGHIFTENSHTTTTSTTKTATTSSDGHRRFMAGTTSTPSISTTTPKALSILAPTIVTSPCAVSTTYETCSAAGMCCAFANRT